MWAFRLLVASTLALAGPVSADEAGRLRTWLYEASCDDAVKWCPVVELVWTGDNIRAEAMPLVVRDVPIHPDDDYAPRENQGPIEDLSYLMGGELGVALMAQRRVLPRLRFGAGLRWFVAFTYDERRNYTNDVGTANRGRGAALTYAGLRKRGSIPGIENEYFDSIFNLSPVAYAEVALLRRWSLSAGSSVSHFHLIGQNGWDRYNRNETHRQFSFGHYLPVTAYLNWGGVIAGASFPLRVHETDLGRSARIATRPTYFFKFRYGM